MLLLEDTRDGVLRKRATAAGGRGSARRRSEENVQRVVTGTVSEEASGGDGVLNEEKMPGMGFRIYFTACTT